VIKLERLLTAVDVFESKWRVCSMDGKLVEYEHGMSRVGIAYRDEEGKVGVYDLCDECVDQLLGELKSVAARKQEKAL